MCADSLWGCVHQAEPSPRFFTNLGCAAKVDQCPPVLRWQPHDVCRLQVPVNVTSPVKVCEAFANVLYYLHTARSDGSRTEIGHCQDPQNVCADSTTALDARAQIWEGTCTMQSEFHSESARYGIFIQRNNHTCMQVNMSMARWLR
jgi:hypothetical protein